MEEKVRKKIVVPHEVLLVEVERMCSTPRCKAKTRLSLTKEEAKNYKGFDCGVCGLWNEDWLTRTDIPEWWDEIN